MSIRTPRRTGPVEDVAWPPAVVFESADVVAVHKPVGIATVAERDPTLASLASRLASDRGERLFVVHRLDKEVSGLVVFARTAEAHRALSLAFERREAHKTYLAAVHGAPPETLALDGPLHTFGSGRVGVDPRGKASRTDVEPLALGAAHAFVAAHPRTGRRHQIRAHLFAAGHPIVGDVLYGDRALQGAHPRLLLHGFALELPPTLGVPRLVAPPDAAFVALVRALVPGAAPPP